MQTFMDMKELRKRATLDLDEIVINKIKDRIFYKNIKQPLYLEFFSLGDLLKGCLLLSVIRGLFPDLTIYIHIAEEYFDYEEIFHEIAEFYSCLSKKDLPNDVFRVGLFDMKVAAYRKYEKRFDVVFPTAQLAAIHKAGSLTGLLSIRKLLGICHEEKVLVIGCFTSVPLKSLSLELKHIGDSSIRHDFEQTHIARYISLENLHFLLRFSIEERIFDRVLLVPRNIREERNTIKRLQKDPFIAIYTEGSKELSNKPVHILAVKGILRVAYSIADVAFVMGFHNVLEPYLVNNQTKTFCIEPPLEAPNRFLYDCGQRLQILNGFKRFPHNKEHIRNLLRCMQKSKNSRIDLDCYMNDELCKSSFQLVANYLNKIFEKMDRILYE